MISTVLTVITIDYDNWVYVQLETSVHFVFSMSVN